MKKILLSTIIVLGILLYTKAQDETVNGNLTVTGNVNINGNYSNLPKHFYHYLYNPSSDRTVYIHSFPSGTDIYNSEPTKFAWRVLTGSSYSTMSYSGINGLIVDGNISSTKNLGVGTNSPKAKLDVGAYINNGELGCVFGRLTEGNTSGDGTFLGVRGYGTQQADYNGKSFAIEHSFYGHVNSSINFFRGGASTGGFISFNVNNNIEAMRINYNGNAVLYGKFEAKEIKVQTAPTADFVFEENYNLKEIDEVESFIKENNHLPDFPSAKEIEENGINLGEMDSKLLQKIEELTLYMIQMNKEIENLKEENRLLKEEIRH